MAEPEDVATSNDTPRNYEDIFVSKTDVEKESTASNVFSDSIDVLIIYTEPWNIDSDADIIYEDTDSDQWLDAQEFQYWKSKGLSDTDAAKNCQTPDVDSDSITDYQEVFGYTVKVITGWDANNTPISKEITMYGNPLAAYKQTDGKWTDTDEDGIPDIVETYFSNISYIDSDSLWQQMIVSTGFDSAYGWCRDYYLELNATSKDMSKPESEREDARSKAENWTQKAFNPFVVYNMPPTIAKWSASVREYHTSSGTIYTIQTEFVVRDIGGIKEVNQKIVELMTGKVVAEHTYIPEARYTEITAGWEFTVDYGTLLLQGYRAVGETTNYAGYSVEASKEIKGLIAIAIDALQALWQMLVGGLQKVWEAVEKAVNAIVEWIKEQITKAMGVLLAPINSAMKSFGESLSDPLLQSYEEYNRTGTVSSATINLINSALELLYITSASLSIAIIGLLLSLKTITFSFSSIAMIILQLVATVIILQLLGSRVEGREFSFLQPSVLTVKVIADSVRDIVYQLIHPNASWEARLSFIFGWLSITLGYVGVFLSIILLGESSTPTRAFSALIAAFIGLIMGILSLSPSFSKVALLFTTISLFASFLGFVCGALSHCPGFEEVSLFSMILSILSFILGVTSLYYLLRSGGGK